MQTEKAFYRKVMNHKSIGPGGWKCNCCAPPPGKVRKMWKRDRKKVERLFTSLLIEKGQLDEPYQRDLDT